MSSRKDSQLEDHFTTSDAAAATGLSGRNVMYLCSLGSIPVAAGGEGRGRYRQFDYEGLARIAVIAAFYNAGIEIYLAARLVEEIGDEANFHQMSNLDSLLSSPHSRIVQEMTILRLDPEHAYYLHKHLRENTNSYCRHKAIEYDRLLEIFDRVYVFLNKLVLNSEDQTLYPGNKPSPLYKITGWKKGSDRVHLDDAPQPGSSRLTKNWASARQDFKGMIRINASLAIRDVLDTMADSRGA